MDIGFIGLGNMGAHMARRLLEAGHRVVVYDTRQEAIGNLTARGAVAAQSPTPRRRSWRACRRPTSYSKSPPGRTA